ncbi:MAG: DUF4129 domain-containing protein, partial [Chloroflexi bacterium]|nr:DUF4129 domain-containing protein [Chloroflexota bacterium]
LYLISPLLDVFNAILEAIIAFWKWAFSRLFIPVDDPQTENTQEAVQDGFQRYLLEQQQIGSDPLVNWRIVLLIMLILALIAAVYALGRYYNKNKVTVENGRFGRIVDTFVSQLAQIRRKKEKKEEAAFDWKTAVTIQRIYAKMSHTAADLGHPRGEAETPYEYLSALHMLWPEHKPEIQTITTAYVKVHYGELPANKEEFNQIEQAWHHIETISEEIAITRK